MSEFLNAVDAFIGYLSLIEWSTIAAGLGFQLLRLVARTFAWRNILRVAYPDTSVPFWGTFGAYVGGIGVNALVPARGGDVLRVVLAKRGISRASLSTVAASLMPEALLDTFVVGAIMVWGVTQGVAPSIHALAGIRTVEWRWLLLHPPWGIAVVAVLLASGIGALAYGARRVRRFWARLAQGWAVLGRPSTYFTRVVPWQALGWSCRLASIYCFLAAFNVPATPGNVLLVIAVQSASTALPATPGGIGTQQGLLAYVFRNTAIGGTALLSFSVGMNIVLTVFNAVLGFGAILIMLRTLRWRRATDAELVEEGVGGP